MLVLASVALAGSLVIAGGGAVLVGAVITIASFTPSYTEREWDDTTSKIGYLVGAPGVAAIFAGSAIELAAAHPALGTVELICALAVSVTVVIVFALPIANRAKQRRAARRQRRRTAGASPSRVPPRR